MADLSVFLKIKLINDAVAPLRAMTNDFAALRTAIQSASAAFDLGMKVKQSMDGVRGFSDKLSGLTAKPLEGAKAIEGSMIRLRLKVEGAGQSFDGVREKLVELGTKGESNLAQVTAATLALTKRGWTAGQALEQLPNFMAAAEGQGIELASAVELVGGTLKSFALDATQTTRITDILTKTASVSGLPFDSLATTLRSIGPSAKLTGVTFEQSAAMLAMFGKAGLSAEEASGALHSMMTRLASPRGAKMTGQVLNAIGVSAKTSTGQLKTVPEIFGDVMKKTEGKSAQFRAKVFGALFGPGVGTQIARMAEVAGPTGLKDLETLLGQSAGAAQKLSDALDETATQADERLASSLSTLSATLGGPLINGAKTWKSLLADIVGATARWAAAHPMTVTGIMLLVKTVAALLGVVVTLGSALGAIAGVKGVLGVAAAVIKTAALLKLQLIPALIATKLAALSLTAVPLVAALAGVAAAIYQITMNWNELKAAFTTPEGLSMLLSWLKGEDSDTAYAKSRMAGASAELAKLPQLSLAPVAPTGPASETVQPVSPTGAIDINVTATGGAKATVKNLKANNIDLSVNSGLAMATAG